ncbi:MAG: hypothetical protein C0410_02770 [Anaerolinea sp.]|nr:hypothetical protein [Anaerolinea sp.]
MSSSALEDRIKHWTSSYSVLAGTNTPEDSTKFVELFNSIYARKISNSYYYWRFFNNIVESTLFFAFKQTELVGACGYNLFKINNDLPIRNALLVDMMVGAKHRSIGLTFSRLNLEIENAARQSGAKCLFLFPNQRGADAWLASEGWVRITQMITCSCKTRPKKMNTSIDIRKVPCFDDWVNIISTAFSRNHPSLTFTKRDKQYLNWRLVDSPVYKYSIHAVYFNEEIYGYIVLKVFHDPMTGNAFGDIVDILWSDDDSNLLNNMLEFALDHFYQQGIKEATTWLQTNTILDDIGHTIGFGDTEQIRDFCYKPLDQTYIWLKDPKNWFITLSDSEIY